MNDKSLQEQYLRRILNSKVYDVAIESPLEEAAALSRKLGNHFLLKREDLQGVHQDAFLAVLLRTCVLHAYNIAYAI